MSIRLIILVIFLASGCYCCEQRNETKYIYVKEMDKVALTCKKGENVLHWFGPKLVNPYAIDYKINPNVKQRERLRIITSEASPELNLQINNFSKEDEGLYCCISKGQNRNENVYDVKMQEDPVNLVIQNEHENDFIHGSVNIALVLICKVVHGTPVGTIEWRSNNKTIVIAKNDTVTFSFIPVPKDHFTNLTCMAQNKFTQIPLKHTVTLLLYHAPEITITYRNISSGRYLICSAEGVPDNFTFYPLEHKSYFNEHIRYLNGSGNGTFMIGKSSNKNKQYHERGLYFCRVSNGVPDGDTFIVTQKYYLNVTGKPIFVSSNIAIQAGIIGRPTKLVVFVVSIPKVKNVTVKHNDLPAINAAFSDDGLVKANDIIYGKNISCLTSKLSVFIILTTQYNKQLFTVTVTNDYGFNRYKFAIIPETKDISNESQKQNFLLLIIILVVFAILFFFGGAIKAIKKNTCNKIRLCRETSETDTELPEEAHPYDEIDNSLVNISPQTTETVTQVQVTNVDGTTISMIKDSGQSDHMLCLSDLESMFNNRVSTPSVNSEMSYLMPSKPYTELRVVRNRTQNEYEKIRTSVECTDHRRTSEIFIPNKQCVKRSTI